MLTRKLFFLPKFQKRVTHLNVLFQNKTANFCKIENGNQKKHKKYSFLRFSLKGNSQFLWLNKLELVKFQ